MDEIMVSVMVMTFNHRPFLREALEGILMQAVPWPIEILVHDDASTDGASWIVREFEGRHPGVVLGIYQDENLYGRTGVYPTIHVYERARGRYIAECDGDDFWTDPLKLARQVGYMEDHPDVVLCHHAYEILEAGTRRPPDRRKPQDYSRDELIAFRIDGYGIGGCTKLYRNLYGPATRNDFENFNGDYPLNVLMGLHGEARYIEGIRPSVYRRMNGSNSWCSLPSAVKAQRTREMFRRIHGLMVAKGNPHHVKLREAFL